MGKKTAALQELPLGPEHPVLATEPRQLISLVARQALRLAGVDVGLVEVPAKAVVRPAQIAGDRLVLPGSPVRRMASVQNAGPYGGLVRGADSTAGAQRPNCQGVHRTGSTRGRFNPPSVGILSAH